MDWISKAPTTPVVENMIHVLLVDHHANAIDMFAYFFLKVTSVRFASTALSILSQGKPKFDLVMENIHSPDGCGFMLLQDTVQKGLPVILLLEEDDVALTKRGLEAGALLCIKKPVTMEIAEYLWQLLLWEKRKRRNNNNMMNVNAADHHHHHHHQDIHVSLRSKVWIEWTKELHDKFMDAVRELGEGKCYPKDILELMNVPGLTRMQVASHLQKCRGGSWKAPNNRKPKLGGGKRSLMSARRSYGCMPPLPTKSVILHADDDATASSVVVDQNDDDEYFEFPNFDTMIPPGLEEEEEDEDMVYYSNQLTNNATVKKENDMMIDWLL